MTVTPRPEHAAVRHQLLYTNVDRFVDGVATSGWQTMETSPGLDGDTRDRLLALVDPTLNLVTPLAGFPTPQEVAAADRRLSQLRTPDGTVLLHTAPAGADTTGRPNTMNHVVVLSDEQRQAFGTADLWRCSAWRVPFGAEEVRDTRLPAPEAFVPGDSRSDALDDAVATFATDDSRREMLSLIADALEPALRARIAGHESRAATVLVPTESTDEAALWIEAVQRTCAPATGSYLGFTTLARITTQMDLDGVVASDFDLVMVPTSDLRVLSADHSAVLVVTPERARGYAPRTGWGRLVRAMTSGLGTWVAAAEGMREILDMLPEHRDLLPAWPLATAEACDPGLLAGSFDGDINAVVDRELVVCQPSALSEAPYLTAVINERVLGSPQTDPAHWYDKLAAVPTSSPISGVVAGLAHKLVQTAVVSPSWLVDTQREGSGQAHRCLEKWSQTQHGAAVLSNAVPAIASSAAETGLPHAVLIAVDRLERDGLHLPAAALTRMLAPTATILAAPGEPETLNTLLEHGLSERVRQTLAGMVEDLLAEAAASGASTVVPRLPANVTQWLTADTSLQDLPHLTMERLSALLLAGVEESQPAVEVWEAMSALPGYFQLSDELSSGLGAWLSVEHIRSGPPGWFNWKDTACGVVLREPGAPGAFELALQLLRDRGHLERDFGSMVFARMSSESASSLLAISRRAPLMTSSIERATVYSSNMVTAWRVLAMVRPDLAAMPAAVDARDRALAVLTLSVWAGQRVDLTGGAGQVDRRLVVAANNLPERLASSAVRLEAETDQGVGPLVQEAVTSLFWVENEHRVGQELRDKAVRFVNFCLSVQEEAGPVFYGRADTVVAIVRAWMAHFGRDPDGRARADLIALIDMESEAESWLNKRVLPSAGGGIRRLFGRS